MAEYPHNSLAAPRISVVIPTYNRGAELRSCLAALIPAFPADAEVIVVSDGGDRAGFPDLSEFEQALRLTVVHATHGGPARARNTGLERARGDIVVFTDDDCLPHSEWVERMAKRISHDPPVAAGGKTFNGLPDNPYAVAAQLILDMGERDQNQRHYGPVFFPANNLAFPADALRSIGGFDESYQTSEDRELCRRWLRAGHGLVKAPDALVTHCPLMNLRTFWRKHLAYGRGAAQFHRSSDQDWPAKCAAFHRRVPWLAAAEMADQKIGRRLRVYAILVVWEVANLLGYLQGKWNIRG